MIEKMSRKLEPLVTAGCKSSYFRSLKFIIVVVILAHCFALVSVKDKYKKISTFLSE